MGFKDIVECVQEDDEVWQADRGPKEELCVSQQTTLEVAGVGILSAVPGCTLNQVRELPVPADKQDDALAVGHVGREVQGQLQMLGCLLQVDDILAQAVTKDVWFHKPVPATGFMAQVYSGLEEALHRKQFLDIEEVRMLQRHI